MLNLLLCCLGCETKITAETETKSQNEAEGISCPSSVERVREVASCCLLRLPHPGSPSPATTVSVSLLAVGRQQCHLRLPGFEVLHHLAASWVFSDWRSCKTDLNLFRCGKFLARISQGKADSLSLILKKKTFESLQTAEGHQIKDWFGILSWYQLSVNQSTTLGRNVLSGNS